MNSLTNILSDEERLTDEEIDLLIQDVDLDGDGLINKAEFEKILKEGYLSKGYSFKSYKSNDGYINEYKPIIFGKKYDPFGNEVIKTKFSDKRTMHWVPKIQKK